MERKEFLEKCIVLGAGIALTTSLSSCHIFDKAEMLVGKVDDLQSKPYFVTQFNGDDIFVFFESEKWTIFSLICSHKKCTVEYKEQEQQFLCPCHDGTYNKAGKVIAGPPPAPLSKFKYEIRKGELWVLNQFENA
jgi:Rieske Fe-S protein